MKEANERLSRVEKEVLERWREKVGREEKMGEIASHSKERCARNDRSTSKEG
jgi:hypothetical protein